PAPSVMDLCGAAAAPSRGRARVGEQAPGATLVGGKAGSHFRGDERRLSVSKNTVALMHHIRKGWVPLSWGRTEIERVQEHCGTHASYSIVKQRKLHRPQVCSGLGFARLFSRSPKVRGRGAPEQTPEEDTRLSSAPPAFPAFAFHGARTRAAHSSRRG